MNQALHIRVKTRKLSATDTKGERVRATEIDPRRARKHTCDVPWNYNLSTEQMHAIAARELAGPAASLVTVTKIDTGRRGYTFLVVLVIPSAQSRWWERLG